MDLQSGLAFLKKWTCKTEVFSVQEPERGKIPFLLLFLPKTYPCGAKVLCAYTLLYIVYGGFDGCYLADVWGGGNF